MCKISLKTVQLANEKTMRRPLIRAIEALSMDSLTVSTRYNGIIFTQTLSIDEINQSFARSLSSLKPSRIKHVKTL